MVSSVVVSGFCGSGIIPVIFSVVSRLIGRIIAARVTANHFLWALNPKVNTAKCNYWVYYS